MITNSIYRKSLRNRFLKNISRSSFILGNIVNICLVIGMTNSYIIFLIAGGASFLLIPTFFLYYGKNTARIKGKLANPTLNSYMIIGVISLILFITGAHVFDPKVVLYLCATAGMAIQFVTVAIITNFKNPEFKKSFVKEIKEKIVYTPGILSFYATLIALILAYAANLTLNYKYLAVLFTSAFELLFLCAHYSYRDKKIREKAVKFFFEYPSFIGSIALVPIALVLIVLFLQGKIILSTAFTIYFVIYLTNYLITSIVLSHLKAKAKYKKTKEELIASEDNVSRNIDDNNSVEEDQIITYRRHRGREILDNVLHNENNRFLTVMNQTLSNFYILRIISKVFYVIFFLFKAFNYLLKKTFDIKNNSLSLINSTRTSLIQSSKIEEVSNQTHASNNIEIEKKEKNINRIDFQRKKDFDICKNEKIAINTLRNTASISRNNRSISR